MSVFNTQAIQAWTDYSASAYQTLHSYFKIILNILSGPLFYTKYLMLPTGETMPSKIYHNPEFFPYFQHAIGAIDESHIPVMPSAHLHPLYQNCKGFLFQNALFVCDFNLKFTYMLTDGKDLQQMPMSLTMLYSPTYRFCQASTCSLMQTFLYTITCLFHIVVSLSSCRVGLYKCMVSGPIPIIL